MKCPKCKSDKTEMVILPSLDFLISKRESIKNKTMKKIKCHACGHEAKL